MEKDIKVIWKHVIDGRAVAINPEGCAVIGEAARWFSPLGTWKIAYLDKIATYYMVDGEVKRDESFD